MANALTSIFGQILPEVTADNNLWGGHNNGDHTSWDRLHGRPQLQRAIVTAGAIDLGTLSQDGAAQGSYQQMTVSGPVTVSFNNVPADPAGSGTNPHIATVFYLKVINGGSNTITWPGTVTWLAGTAPFLRVAGTDLLMFATNDNGTSWIGAHISSVPDLQPVQSVAWVNGGTTHLDLQTGNDFKFTVAAGASTIAFDNAGATLAGNARRLRITITNGGSQTVTWPASVTWLAGAAPVLRNPGVDQVDLYTPDLGVTWYGSLDRKSVV